MNEKILTMKLINEKYGVCRLNKEDDIPKWTKSSDFISITKTEDELSIVCIENIIPEDIKCERDWRMLKVEGVLDFSLVGILSKISTVLANNSISIFAISTYDTDYILLKDKDLIKAIKALKDENYEIIN